MVLGKALSAGVRALSQAAVVYGLAFLIGVKLNWNPLALVGVLTIVVLAAILFKLNNCLLRVSSLRFRTK
jgi:ABC-2 type transport system permease protein